jgi:hypothetical protein
LDFSIPKAWSSRRPGHANFVDVPHREIDQVWVYMAKLSSRKLVSSARSGSP